ncbi:hypothetical protein PRUB_a4206 [Pseudoalteromonas rubra]|uniref:Tail specific protease domain-containing protein n=1 Tax=Pseudoalteromonas rubra TaxID=43658 RepID=A0A8T0C657_9GAMM|nr:hypothetical protein [Pseudoalteromonas rubra]KAF7785531.1 hypothetical protein PRUB_a4206 [Pseudoalteromonas rubra]
MYKAILGLLGFIVLSGQQLQATPSRGTPGYHNDAYQIPVLPNQLRDPVGYYHNKEQLFTLVEQENWPAVVKLATVLTRDYQNDGVTWYLLSLGYRQQQRWQDAIAPLKRALQLGVRLQRLPKWHDNPNDMMMTLAELYGALKDKHNAMVWLERALRARWDDKPSLTGRSVFSRTPNPHFAAFAQDADYRRLVGAEPAPDLDRDARWRHDLQYLAAEIRRLHVSAFHRMSEQAFAHKVAQIDKRIPALRDQQIVFELMQLLGMLENGHNFIIPAWGKAGNYQQLPVQFYLFEEGLFIVAADPDYQHFVGMQVLTIGNTPALQALAKTGEVNPRDNNMQQAWLGPYYLSLAPVLQGLGIIEHSNEIAVTVRGHDQQTQQLVLTPRTMQFNGFPKLPRQHPHSGPYWSKLLSEHKALYVNFNAVHERQDVSLDAFNQQLRERLLAGQAEHFILDLRDNSGGNGFLLPSTIATAVLFEALKPDGKLMILTGRNTFSAGHDLLMGISKLTSAVVVGEPSGTRPNAIGEAGWFTLPYSGQIGVISSQFHQQGAAEDSRVWVAPDLPVALTAKDYFSGKDAVLEAALTGLSGTSR